MFFWQLEMFDVCTTGDTAHIDTIFKFLPHTSTWVHRYSSLLQWSVPLGHVAIVGRIPGLWHIPKGKITRLMSGDLWGHSISGWSFPDARPIQRSGNTVFRYWRTSQCKWAGLPSWWNMNVGMFCSCDIGHSCNMSRYVMLVTVSSAKKNGPYTFDMNMSYRLAFCKTIVANSWDGSDVNDNRFQYMQERHDTQHTTWYQ